MGLFRFKPARDQAREEPKVIIDLDALVSKPQFFRYGGKNHRIKPISTLTYLEISEKYAQIALLQKKKDVTKADFIDSYAELFGMVCGSIRRKDVEEMTIAQRGALLQFILDCLKGSAQVEDPEKKKTMSHPTSSSSIG